MSNTKLDGVAASASTSECYYAVLGLRKHASPAEIRSAYRNLALKWHPDRWVRNDPLLVGDAKRRFQQIQEAYSVLSDNGKRLLYDAGLLDPFVDLNDDDDYDVEGFSDFVQEILAMMESSRHQKRHTLEELQEMLREMMAGDDTFKFNFFDNCIHQASRKRTRFT